jgi:hypothetical protein
VILPCVLKLTKQGKIFSVLQIFSSLYVQHVVLHVKF